MYLMIYIFRLITSRRFYLGMLFTSLVVFGLTKMDVVWFRRTPAVNVSTSLKVGNQQFTPRQHIRNVATMIIYKHIQLWNEWSAGFLTLGNTQIQGNDVEQATQLTQLLTTYNQTNVIDLVRHSHDRTTDIQTFLNQGNTTVRQAQYINQRLQSTINSYNTQLSTCKVNKSAADTSYRQGLSSNNATLIDQATKKAIEMNTCIANSSTSINSLQGVYNNLSNVIKKSQQYIAVIRTHQSTLVTYPDLIGTDTPSTIIQLQKDFASLASS